MVKSKWKVWARFALEAAPVLASLSRASHPIAWVAAGLHLMDKAWRLSGPDKAMASASPWRGLSWEQQCAIVGLLSDLGIGEVHDVHEDGLVVREIGGVTFGRLGDAYHGPCATRADFDVSAAFAEMWSRASSYTLSSPVSMAGRVSLQADAPRDQVEPSTRVTKIAADCASLRAAGHRVGLLLDGPPGSGKSQALLHVADACGGRTLRASMQRTDPADLAAIALVIRPDAVIFDDIDRGDSASLLDSVDVLAAAGVVVLASSNDQSQICEALLREGRIDDHHTLSAIEPDTLASLSGRLSPTEIQDLSDLTVAAVMRYLDIRDTLGPARAEDFLRTHRKA